MKCIAAVSLIMAFVVAEPPPSNSYLPPPRSYPQSSTSNLPQVVAARSQPRKPDHGLGHGAAANGFARSGLQGGGAFGAPNLASSAQPRFNQGYDQKHGYDQKKHGYDHNEHGYDQKEHGHDQNGQGYDQNARNAFEEVSEPANYNFGYMVNDHHEGTDFGHHEERQEARAQGEYHVVLPDGRKQTVSYEADEHGFKPQISYEDTEDLSRSGYDSNANNFRSPNGQGNENSYQSNEHGYQSNEHGYQGNEHGYQGNEHGYQGNEHGYQSNEHGYQGNDNGYKAEHGHKSNQNSYSGNQNGGRIQNGGYTSARASGY